MLIGVVGAGTMGSGIAQAAAAAGHDVIVVDANETALANGEAAVGKALAASTARGSLDADKATAIAARIRWTAAIADLAPAGLVIEAIVERMDAKLGLFGTLAGLVAKDAVLASNTSSLSIGEMAAGVPEPGRFIGLHFFNPASVMKLVEVVPAPETHADVADAMIALMRSWGKRPVRVRDVPGFIVNRVARPYYAEGFAAWSEGIAPETIDRAMTASGGFRMGPLALADMIGHDVNYAVASSVYDAYAGRTRFRPQPAQAALVESGRLGRKAGGGVYPAGPVPAAQLAEAGPAPQQVRVPVQGDPLAGLLRDAGLTCIEAADLPSGVLEVDGVRLTVTDGRPLSARDDVDALIDIQRDPAKADTIVITGRDARAEAAVAGLVQAIGRAALIVPDRPGMLVLRSLAQLANAAADAVADAVASADAIDEAMVYGANHPEGPLAWADRIGRPKVAQALRNIAEATGNAMYAPAALLADA